MIYKALLTLVSVLLVLSCSEPPEQIHKKLDTLLQSDLTYMVAEIKKETGTKNLLDTPYFVIKDLRFFEGDTARVYGAYAEVDFHYLKGIEIYQKRKYRYDARYSFWDRYYKQLRHNTAK